MIIAPKSTALKFKPSGIAQRERLREVVATVMAAKDEWPIGPRTIGYEMDAAYGSFKKPHWASIKNHKDRVTEIVAYARINGLIPWRAIADASGRGYEGARGFLSVQDFLDERYYHLLKYFRYNATYNQPIYYEVWVEKADLLVTASKAALPFGVPAMACGGFTSHKWLKGAAERFKAESRPCVILAFTDLNTGGLRIAQHISSHLATHYKVSNVTVDRCGMNPEHIQPHFNPAPLKGTKPDIKAFIDLFGISEGHEINALLLKGIGKLIAATLKDKLDPDLLGEATAGESNMKSKLDDLGRWASDIIQEEAEDRGVV